MPTKQKGKSNQKKREKFQKKHPEGRKAFGHNKKRQKQQKKRSSNLIKKNPMPEETQNNEVEVAEDTKDTPENTSNGDDSKTD